MTSEAQAPSAQLLDPDHPGVASLRSALWAAGFQADRVREAFGAEGENLIPSPSQVALLARNLEPGAPLTALLSLFLLDLPVPSDEAARALAPLTLEAAAEIGVIEAAAGQVRARVRLIPYAGFVFACSLTPESRAVEADHVMSALARRVADELADAGWQLKAVLTDNGQEFRSHVFGNAVRHIGAKQRFIRAGRPQTNGCVERVQRTILEECWRPTFARSLVPKYTALRRDLDEYLRYYNWDRGHTSRRSNGQPPAVKVYGARKCTPDDRHLSDHLGVCSP